jgi:hypothetical protein
VECEIGDVRQKGCTRTFYTNEALDEYGHIDYINNKCPYFEAVKPAKEAEK